MQGSRCRVQGTRGRVQGSGRKVQGTRGRVQGSRFRVSRHPPGPEQPRPEKIGTRNTLESGPEKTLAPAGRRVQGAGFRVQGAGFRLVSCYLYLVP